VFKKSAFLFIIIAIGFTACSNDDKGVGGVDGTLPAAISDLQVIDTIATALRLSWTAPGDDSMTGQAASYDIRIASSAEYLIYYWGDATKVPDSLMPTPSPAGEKDSLLIENLTFLYRYYFAVRAKDDAGNTSYMSNIVSARPFADTIVVLGDDSLDAVVREHLNLDPDSTIWYSQMLTLDTLNGSNRHILNIDKIYYAAFLTRLELAHNQISTIDVLSRLKMLDTLNLAYNQIENIDSLSKLTGLRRLYLNNNEIVDISALSGLSNLVYVTLDSNLITSIYPLYQNGYLGTGDSISIRGNPITDSLYIDSLRERGATVIDQ
jgi:hypothetical protein